MRRSPPVILSPSASLRINSAKNLRDRLSPRLRFGFALATLLLFMLPAVSANQAPPAASPSYLYAILDGPSSSIWVSEGPRKVAHVPHREGYGIKGRVSPDGAFLAYNALASSGELWVLRLSDGSSRRLATGVDVVRVPLWSPDGSSLVFRRETALLSVEVAGGRLSTVLAEAPVQGVYPFDWRPEGLYYAVINGGTDVFRGSQHLFRASEGIARDFRLVGDRVVYNEVAPGGLRLAGDVPPPHGMPANAEFLGWLP